MSVLPLLIKDTLGTTVVSSSNARIKKIPELDRGKDVTAIEWVIVCGRIDIFIGGALSGTYDPMLYAMTFGGITITGLAEGTFFKAKRNVEAFTEYVGTDGDVAWARQHNKSGEVSFLLKSTSPCNDLLSALAKTDEYTLPV